MVFQFLSPVGHKFFCWNCAGIVHGSRIGCQNGGANSDFLHSSGREELDSLPIVLELENTLWFSNSCLQLGTNSFAGIVHGSRIGCQNGGANSDFLHSSGREELDSLPIVLELENTLWFSNSCLQLGTNSFAGIVHGSRIGCQNGGANSDFLHSSEDYVRVLRGEKFPPMKNISFRSHLHEIFTEQMWKVALSAEDDKRIVMADGIQTLAIGHWRLRWRASGGL